MDLLSTVKMKKLICLVLGHSWNNLHEHWLLMNYLYFKDHLSFHLCLQIQLADSKPQEGQFLNVSFLPNFFFQILEFQIEIK